MDKAKLKMKTSTTISSSTKEEYNEKPPKGAILSEQSVRTETEEIENGWLVCKYHSGRYKTKDSTDDYGRYYSYTEKWYSEDNPVTITINNKSLAEAFEE